MPSISLNLLKGSALRIRGRECFSRCPGMGAAMRIRHRLILALDVTDADRARSLAKAAQGHVDAIKVNWPLVLGSEPGLIRTLSGSDYVLADFKVADIPNTNRLIVEHAVRAGASGVICHAFAGEDSVRACVEAAGGADVFVVTEMSHPGGREYTAKFAEEFARLAVRAGAAGIIAPATRPDRIRVLREIVGQKRILAPGVGAQGGKAAESIAAGADAIIVGRAVYEAKDPAAAVRDLAEELRSIRP